MRRFVAIICIQGVSFFGISALAQTKVVAPQHRSTLARARTAFVASEAPARSGDHVNVRELRAALERWHRFDLVDGSDRADVTLTFGEQDVKQVVSTGVPAGTALVNPETAMVLRRVVTLTLRHRATGEILWRGQGPTVASIVQRLQDDLPPRDVSVCIAFWCR